MKNKYKECFTYERKPLENNEYHGNLLLNISGVSKSIKKLISSELALNVDMIYTYNKAESQWKVL